MPAIQKQVQRFLSDQGLDFSKLAFQDFSEAFQSEMRKGLAGEASSLAMLPTYVNLERSIPAGRAVMVIDAGGTNLRVCKVTFDELGQEHVEDFRQFPMPGTHGLLSADVFFSLFAQYLSSVSDNSPEIDSIGLCFSYPTTMLPNHDGILMGWSKEVQAPEVIGQAIGKGILAHVKDGQNKRVVLLNDTVATLLAGKAQGELHQCSQYAGFILGTGTNLAIVQPNSAILKCFDEKALGQQAINIESGNFNRLFQGVADSRFDASTKNPGQYVFEKMASGAYLGPLFSSILKAAAQENLLSATLAQRLVEGQTLTSLDLNNLLRNPFQKGPLSVGSEGDLEVCVRIGQHLVDRAAHLCAFKIASGLLFMGGGRNILHPICLNIDGSTVHKMYSYYRTMATRLEALLKPEGVHVLLVQKDNAPVLGAAIAALTN